MQLLGPYVPPDFSLHQRSLYPRPLRQGAVRSKVTVVTVVVVAVVATVGTVVVVTVVMVTGADVVAAT